MPRDIIEIDKEKCTGCGLCINGCAEGALAIVDGKVAIINDAYCDGLGACLTACPEGALRIIKRDAPEFDEEAAMAAKKIREESARSMCGCLGSMARKIDPAMSIKARRGKDHEEPFQAPSALSNWPIQLSLIPAQAPYLKKAHLLMAADCVGFALSRLHESFLAGKVLLIGCPKLDNAASYVDKLAEIIQYNETSEITALHMTIPCCRGMRAIVDKAIKMAGARIAPRVFLIGADGKVEEAEQRKGSVE